LSSVAVVTDDERAHWIVLSMAAGIGPVRFQRLLEVCGGAAAAWHATNRELALAGVEPRTAAALRQLRAQTTPADVAERLSRLQISALTLLDEDYPANLRRVADPPPVLFLRGSVQPADTQAVALVGTRRASSYGRAVAERLAEDLAAAGVTIVSGLARGIDTAAHAAAVRAGGRTLAVLGNGLDQVYPPENAGLARQIVARAAGALVSEFAPGIPPDAVNFPRRNRIISGLAVATVIVEAGERSGALITADFALEQGRDVLAVPGSIFSPLSAGVHELLKQGAAPVTTAGDILSLLGAPAGMPEAPAPVNVGELSNTEKTVWEVLDAEPRHIDDVVRTVRLTAADVSPALMLLELKGLARQVGAMLYTRT
jgi:DNA processing protein